MDNNNDDDDYVEMTVAVANVYMWLQFDYQGDGRLLK